MQVNKPKRRISEICKSTFLLFIIYSISFFGNCQSQSITWQRTYDGPFRYKDGAKSLCPADNGNFYAVGYTYHPTNPLIRFLFILKVNEYGDTLWTRYFGWNRIYEANASVSDGFGGCILTGQGDSSFTTRISPNGSVVWWKNYGTRQTQCFDIKKTENKGYIICGRKLNTHWFGYVLKTDSLGELEWQNQYLSSEYKGYEGVIEINDGYLLAGTIMDSPVDTAQILVTRIDNSGILLWERRYTINNRNASGQVIVKLINSYLIAGGTSDSTGLSQVYFMRIDTSGNEIFVKRYLSNKTEVFKDIKVINPNRYILVFTRDSTSDISSSKVIIVDSLGNILREKIFSTPYTEGYIWFESIFLIPNGDFLFAGSSDLTYNDSSDVYITRTDSLLYSPPIGIVTYSNKVPENFALYPAYPNPFNPETIISFDLPKAGNVLLSLYDVTGKLVDVLLDEEKKAGTYQYKFKSGRYTLSSGTYFIRLQAGLGFVQTQKLILIK